MVTTIGVFLSLMTPNGETCELQYSTSTEPINPLFVAKTLKAASTAPRMENGIIIGCKTAGCGWSG
ncbi:hypothetical protein ABID59_000970 [Bradyrhizobium sp. S3.3.6]